MTEEYIPRKVVRFSAELFRLLLTNGSRIDAICTGGLPHDARLISIEVGANGEVWAYFESPSFSLDHPDLTPIYTALYTDDILARAEQIIGQSQDQDAVAWLKDYRAIKDKL